MAQSGRKLKKCCYLQPEVRENMKPRIAYKRPTIPFEDETVHRTSYMPISPQMARQCKLDSMRPNLQLDLNKNLKMDTDTTHSLSYMPVNTRPRTTPPWALKQKFLRPLIPMDLNTIYENSYQLPGRFVECDEGNQNPNLIVAYAEDCSDLQGIKLPDGPHKYWSKGRRNRTA